MKMPVESKHPLDNPPRLPGGMTGAGDSIPLPATSQSAMRRRALVVGAEPAALRLCRDCLESAGFVVEAVERGIDALVAARENRPDVIFMDAQLRDVSGRQAIKWLRSLAGLRSTPIIVLTAEAEDDALMAATRPAPSLRKPLSRVAVRRALHDVLDQLEM